MALQDAQRWLDPTTGETGPEPYVTPDDIKSALAQVYADMRADGPTGPLPFTYPFAVNVPGIPTGGTMGRAEVYDNFVQNGLLAPPGYFRGQWVATDDYPPGSVVQWDNRYWVAENHIEKNWPPNVDPSWLIIELGSLIRIFNAMQAESQTHFYEVTPQETLDQSALPTGTGVWELDPGKGPRPQRYPTNVVPSLGDGSYKDPTLGDINAPIWFATTSYAMGNVVFTPDPQTGEKVYWSADRLAPTGAQPGIAPEWIKLTRPPLPIIPGTILPTGPILATSATGPSGASGATGTGVGGGATGATGATGVTGPTGPAVAGLILKGSVASAYNLPPTGHTGDLYVAMKERHVYLYDGRAFVDIGDIKGVDGNDGATGPTGACGPCWRAHRPDRGHRPPRTHGHGPHRARGPQGCHRPNRAHRNPGDHGGHGSRLPAQRCHRQRRHVRPDAPVPADVGRPVRHQRSLQDGVRSAGGEGGCPGGGSRKGGRHRAHGRHGCHGCDRCHGTDRSDRTVTARGRAAHGTQGRTEVVRPGT